jgi:hypothetical protein
MATAQHGLAGLSQSLAAEASPHGVRVLALTAARGHSHDQLAGAAAYLLAHPGSAMGSPLVSAAALLERAGFGDPLEPNAAVAPPTLDRSATLAHAFVLSQRLAAHLMDTDGEFDRLPIAVRPMARGVFVSQVGHRSQDVLRAVQKLGEQLQRMQASHSGTDTEFQVDYPRLASLFERLAAYYQALPDETARLTTDTALLAHLRRQTSEREAIIHDLMSTLNAVHSQKT